MENILNETKFLMKKYKISANKSLGQNFLINDEAVDDIVSSSKICSDDLVIEIGPGLGTLTKELLEKAAKVIAIELDTRMIKILNDRFSLYNNFEIINEDVLKVDLEKLISDQKNNLPQIKNVKIVANLPYYITTPIIMKLLEDRLSIDTITVMIQKEVADRIVSVPGSKLSGAITYTVNYYAEPESIRLVGRECFIPQPNVDSEVIKLNVRKEPVIKVKNQDLFFSIIKCSFMQRRKTLINALVNGNIIENKETAKKILNELKLNENIRGEVLSIEEFGRLSDYIENIK
ncbi:MAG: 16S rRNA (adenine(1518)-N(6)/adenine(1519)-N(6))-dimethyltransferase RsmA [Clostridia bacterium]|jgi:16S rRNA (adenine1518-N6/adenine1519-N6)-dimethyltransferase|nr:16S rRNA (adenine(1518)-N(6)/adenine(1519)-N(6))-dimethyltransferase RsmA [Clostridiaceae bacterium]HJJ14025.1 16S rRNA (adenine(1518)-N(6)/adenine(1519)-N(6))-dimethyltransferase RsmA [Clostridiaceae bacterium]